MKQYLLILVLAGFWGISGLVIGAGVDALVGGNLMVPCASLNVIIGLLLLLMTTRSERARRIFYEGPRGNEEGIIGLAFLWAVPIVLVFLGIFWWVLAQFLRY
jgi:hypothetical protein